MEVFQLRFHGQMLTICRTSLSVEAAELGTLFLVQILLDGTP